MKTRILFLMAIAASVSAFGTITPDSDKKTLTIDVQSGSDTSEISLNSDYAKYTVVKTGAGTFTMKSKDNQYFQGNIEVKGGTLCAASLKSFGKVRNVTVSNGATFDVSGAEGGYLNWYGNLYISGTGVNGAGAITGVNTSKEGLQFYEVVPVALLVAGTQAATGHRTMDTNLFFEGELIDATTNKPVLKVVRKGEGKDLNNESTPMSVETLKQVVDDMATDATMFDVNKK